MSNLNQPVTFTFAIDGIDLDFRVLSFEGKEQISHRHKMAVHLINGHGRLESERFMRKTASLRFGDNGKTFHGLIDEFELERPDGGQLPTKPRQLAANYRQLGLAA